MANQIAKFKKYVDLLDEVYQNESNTAVLESDATLAQAGANANEIVIPKLDMDGLGDYDRNSGYVNGDVTMTNETVQFNYDRGRKFSIDNMDNEETAGLAFGKLAAEFIRTKVVPEQDAFRFAKYASLADTKKKETLSSGTEVLAALQTATSDMDDAEVPAENRHLFITPSLLIAAQNVDTNKSRDILGAFASITKVPTVRFMTLVGLLDGSTTGETRGGFTKVSTKFKATADVAVDTGKTYYTRSGQGTTAAPYVFAAVAEPATASIGSYYEVDTDGSHKLNFLIAEKSAIMQYTKHRVDKAIPPEDNPDADAWIFNFREYGLADMYENKTAGVYASYNGADLAQEMKA
jgi:hypothetical protein